MVLKPLLLLLLVITMVAAAERNIITHLKGFDGPLPVSLETGYVEVDKTHGVEFFYYFIESERKPAEDPVILWISGGPGCSGLNALLLEIGPLKLDIAGYAVARGFPGLLYFKDSWAKVSNVIFVDVPVGSGFSYAREEEGLNVTLTALGRQLRVFLHKWMDQHPELASNPLYIGGDSYSGYTVTVTTLEVANNPGNGNGQLLNLVGYMVGNARGEFNNDNAGRLPYMHGMGLISDELYEAALSSCAVGGRNRWCSEAQQAIHEATSDVNMMHILEPLCGEDVSPRMPDLGLSPSITPRQLQEGDEQLDLVLPLECRSNKYNLANRWANDAEVKEMLGVREGSIGEGSWLLCPKLRMPHFHNDVRSTIPYHRELTQRGYRALVYNGDHDLVVPFVSTQSWIRSLGYPVVAPWRPWYSNKEVAGFTTEYAYNLTFATVKGAGHMAPESRPKECLDMFQRWISPAGKL